jgi:hypothetical protein
MASRSLVKAVISPPRPLGKKDRVNQPIELMSSREKVRALRPERFLAVERLVRNEVALQRLLATSRRAASTQMSAARRAKSVMLGRAAAKTPPNPL